MPIDVVSKVLAFTTPADAGRSSAVSRLFRAASSSDGLWNRFLPSDIDEILPRAVAPIEFSSKKDLFFRLCDPILIDGGNKLEEDSGGFQSPVQEASISIGAHVSETRAILKPGRRRTTDPTIQVPRTRDDGWMEIEMGEFLNDDYEQSVRFRFRQVTEMNWKWGLIVQGVEFRPKN
ncbi:hypothetical protein GW17_00002052 [Ensete ventricosum]|nr:hypothetical protein GW17_00002052 [Ensete ventricosum]